MNTIPNPPVHSEFELNQIRTALNAHAIVSITDTSGLILEANDKFYEFTGYTPYEIIGKSHRLIKSGLHPKSFYHELWRTIKNGQVWYGELCNRSKNGTFHWFSASISPIRDSEGRIHKFIAIRTDITNQKKQSQDLRVSLENTQKIIQSKNNFLRTMSHEIRTPMNGIMGMSNLLMDTILTEKQQEYTSLIQESTETLLCTMQDILDFASLESNQINLEISPFEIHTLIDGVIDTLSPKFTHSQTELAHYISPQSEGLFQGDAGRIQQILLNLCQSLNHHSPNNAISIWVDYQNTSLDIKVTASNASLDEFHLHALIQLFKSKGDLFKPELRDSQLPLAICKKLLDLMGAKIEIYKTPNNEIHFNTSFPLQQLNLGINEHNINPLKNKHLLVVNQSPTQQKVIQQQLSDWEMGAIWIQDIQELNHSISSAYQAGFDIHGILIIHTHPKHTPQSISNECNSTTIPCISITTPIRPFDLHFTLLETLTLSHPLDEKTNYENTTPTQDDDAPSLKILLVEDNAINRQVASGFIKHFGHRIDLVENGLEALEQVQKYPYDLILMDIQMPIMDGITATQNIRQLPSAVRSIPIIAMTANAMQEDQQACMNAGMNDYMVKPIDKNKLKQLLQNWAEKIHKNTQFDDFEYTPPTEEHTPSHQICDQKIQNNLKEVLGDEVLQTLNDAFIESVIKHLSDLTQLNYPADRARILIIAHTLKGSAANLGYNLFAEHARTLEHDMKSNTDSDYHELLGELIHTFQITFPQNPVQT